MRAANPIHPGEMLLEEFLRPGGVSQRAFAKRIGWTVAKLNEFQPEFITGYTSSLEALAREEEQGRLRLRHQTHPEHRLALQQPRREP